MSMPYVERPAADRSWMQSFVMCACLFLSFLSMLVCMGIYVELRHATEAIQAARQSAEQSRLEIASYIQFTQRSLPSTRPADATPVPHFVPAPVSPLPLPILRQRGLPEPLAENFKSQTEKDRKTDIPENGKFVLVTEEGKGAQPEEKKFKLLGDK